MIAKLVARGADRDEAIDELAAMLEQAEIWPVRTNAAFLLNALLDDDFVAAELDTGFIPRKLDSLVPDASVDETIWRAAAIIALAEEEEQPLAGFRLNAPQQPSVVLGQGGERRRILVSDDQPFAPASGFRDDEKVVVFFEGQAFGFDRCARGKIGAAAGDGALLAPMPGKVTSVDVAAGEQVAKGQRLLTLEAMKMEHAMLAPFDGVVAELNVEAGAQVQVEVVLARVQALNK
jgi:3-methylcrotonyl-CoA carboxylase alpha subunit